MELPGSFYFPHMVYIVQVAAPIGCGIDQPDPDRTADFGIDYLPNLFPGDDHYPGSLNV